MSTNTTLQIKRSANTAVPSSLANGELAFSSNGGVLFIGDPATGAVQAIGGDRAPGTLTANQAIVVDGNIHIRPIMYLALSYDHRIIDGKEAVSFLKIVKESLEQPQRLFLNI